MATATTAPWGTQLQYLVGAQKVTNVNTTAKPKKVEEEASLYTVVRVVNVGVQYFFSSVSGIKNFAKIIFTAYDWTLYLNRPLAKAYGFANVTRIARTFKDGISVLEVVTGLGEFGKPLSKKSLIEKADAGLLDQIWKKAAQVATWTISACDTGHFGINVGFIDSKCSTADLIRRATNWGYFFSGNLYASRGLYETGAKIYTGGITDPETGKTVTITRNDKILCAIEVLFFVSVAGLTWTLSSPGITGQVLSDQTFWKNTFYTGTIVGGVSKYFWEKIVLKKPV